MKERILEKKLEPKILHSNWPMIPVNLMDTSLPSMCI